MKVKYVSMIVLVGVLAVMSGKPLLSSGTITNFAYAKYATDTQSQANSNECNTGTNCAIISPQTQGDGTANSPTNLQISKYNEDQEQDGGVALPEDPVGLLHLITEFVCPQGFESVCPPPTGTLKFIHTDGVALPDSTGLDRTVIVIFLRTTTPAPFPTFYFVEQVPQPPPSGLVVHTTRTPDCGPAEIIQDDVKTCIITNTYSVAPPP